MDLDKINELLDWLVKQLKEREDVDSASRVDGENAVGLDLNGVTYFVSIEEA